MKKKYGNIESMALVNRKTGKKIVNLIPVRFDGPEYFVQPTVKATEDMLIRVVTRNELGQRVTFFMKKA